MNRAEITTSRERAARNRNRDAGAEAGALARRGRSCGARALLAFVTLGALVAADTLSAQNIYIANGRRVFDDASGRFAARSPFQGGATWTLGPGSPLANGYEGSGLVDEANGCVRIQGKTFLNTKSAKWGETDWAGCGNCHTNGLTDQTNWEFPDAPRRVAAFEDAEEISAWVRGLGPASGDTKQLNWASVRDEFDFENNVRGVSATQSSERLFETAGAGGAFVVRIPPPQATAITITIPVAGMVFPLMSDFRVPAPPPLKTEYLILWTPPGGWDGPRTPQMPALPLDGPGWFDAVPNGARDSQNDPQRAPCEEEDFNG